MGAENSKTEQRGQASREAYENMLKLQREMYEEKIKDLTRKTAAAKNHTNVEDKLLREQIRQETARQIMNETMLQRPHMLERDNQIIRQTLNHPANQTSSQYNLAFQQTSSPHQTISPGNYPPQQTNVTTQQTVASQIINQRANSPSIFASQPTGFSSQQNMPSVQQIIRNAPQQSNVQTEQLNSTHPFKVPLEYQPPSAHATGSKSTLQNNGTVSQTNVAPLRNAGPSNQSAGPSTSQTAGFERQRTPYNYAESNLPSSSQNILYPNLKKDNDESFVFVNSSFIPKQPSNLRNNQDYIQRSKPTPSAPPLDGFQNAKFARSRSHSRSRTPHKENTKQNDVPNNNSSSMLACPTCKNTYTLTVYQCNNGHSSCKNCKMRGIGCGVCSHRITDMRNIALEAFIAEQTVPCANASDGCTLHIKMCDMEIHEKECPYKELKCPKLRCSWRGKLSALTTHFNERHPENCVGSVAKEMYLSDIRKDNDFMYIVDIGPFVFFVHLKVSVKESNLYMTVQLLGTTVGATKWSYELNIYNKREPRRKYQYVDICHSNSMAVDEIFNQAKCAVIPLSYAQTFFSEGHLTYKFFIKKDIDNNNKRWNNKNYRGRGGKH